MKCLLKIKPHKLLQLVGFASKRRLNILKHFKMWRFVSQKKLSIYSRYTSCSITKSLRRFYEENIFFQLKSLRSVNWGGSQKIYFLVQQGEIFRHIYGLIFKRYSTCRHDFWSDLESSSFFPFSIYEFSYKQLLLHNGGVFFPLFPRCGFW